MLNLKYHPFFFICLFISGNRTQMGERLQLDPNKPDSEVQKENRDKIET